MIRGLLFLQVLSVLCFRFGVPVHLFWSMFSGEIVDALQPVVGYFPSPSFRVMNTGEGTVQVTTLKTKDKKNCNDRDIDKIIEHCQFAQFGPRIKFEGIIEWAIPKTAHTSIQQQQQQQQQQQRILIVKRGLCSFETKMKNAINAGATGVILINDEDTTFLAISDKTTSVQEEFKTIIDILTPASTAEDVSDIPFVVVSSSSGLSLLDGVSVSVTPLDADKSKCWGNWDTLSLLSSSSSLTPKKPVLPGNDNDDDDVERSFVLPLFPVSKEPLLPGGTLQMQIGQREYEELEYYRQQQQQRTAITGEDDDNSTGIPLTVVYVAVAYCLDPNINILGEAATLAMIDYSSAVQELSVDNENGKQPRERMVSVQGIEPCQLRTLIRQSTRAGLGLGLIDRCRRNETSRTNNNDNGVAASVSATKDILDKIRITINMSQQLLNKSARNFEMDSLLLSAVDDVDRFSFDVCTMLDLPPRQQQAVLACSTPERIHGIHQILDRITINSKENRKTIMQNESSSNSSRLNNNNNFIATAVKKVLPSIVSVEINEKRENTKAAGSDNDKAAGFFIARDGIIVTNRHVIAKVTDHDAGYSFSTSPTITVTLQDGGSYSAEILAVSESYDIAFLKIQSSSHFPVASLGKGGDVQLGDWMVAIGCPAEFENVVSLGIASTIQRPPKKKTATNTNFNLDTSPTFIGTDALFNLGISGGPLVNDVGDVVGMCTYLREDLNGLGFALSINRIVDAFDELSYLGEKHLIEEQWPKSNDEY